MCRICVCVCVYVCERHWRRTARLQSRRLCVCVCECTALVSVSVCMRSRKRANRVRFVCFDALCFVVVPRTDGSTHTHTHTSFQCGSFDCHLSLHENYITIANPNSNTCQTACRRVGTPFLSLLVRPCRLCVCVCVCLRELHVRTCGVNIELIRVAVAHMRCAALRVGRSAFIIKLSAYASAHARARRAKHGNIATNIGGARRPTANATTLIVSILWQPISGCRVRVSVCLCVCAAPTNCRTLKPHRRMLMDVLDHKHTHTDLGRILRR